MPEVDDQFMEDFYYAMDKIYSNTESIRKKIETMDQRMSSIEKTDISSDVIDGISDTNVNVSEKSIDQIAGQVSPKVTKDLKETLDDVLSSTIADSFEKVGLNREVTGLRDGGIVKSPGPYLVGEEQPEVLDLNEGDKVTPLDKIEKETVKEQPIVNIINQPSQQLNAAQEEKETDDTNIEDQKNVITREVLGEALPDNDDRTDVLEKLTDKIANLGENEIKTQQIIQENNDNAEVNRALNESKQANVDVLGVIEEATELRNAEEGIGGKTQSRENSVDYLVSPEAEKDNDKDTEIQETQDSLDIKRTVSKLNENLERESSTGSDNKEILDRLDKLNDSLLEYVKTIEETRTESSETVGRESNKQNRSDRRDDKKNKRQERRDNIVHDPEAIRLLNEISSRLSSPLSVTESLPFRPDSKFK